MSAQNSSAKRKRHIACVLVVTVFVISAMIFVACKGQFDYSIEVDYDYTVEGRRYKGTRVSFVGKGYGSWKEADRARRPLLQNKGAAIALVAVREPFWWLVVLMILPAAFFGGLAPFVYGAFGRREVTLGNGSGVYFNGVGRLGIYRHFSYDGQTVVRRGQTAYRQNGRHLMEVQLRTPSSAGDLRLFAHPDDAVLVLVAIVVTVAR